MSNRLLKNADTYSEAIRTAGGRAAAELKRAGVAVYYMDESIAEGIIRELPDGTRQKVEINKNEEIVVEQLAPAP
jgi:hypothetical protein